MLVAGVCAGVSGELSDAPRRSSKTICKHVMIGQIQTA